MPNAAAAAPPPARAPSSGAAETSIDVVNLVELINARPAIALARFWRDATLLGAARRSNRMPGGEVVKQEPPGGTDTASRGSR
jgi:hypothetical protein